MAVAAYKDALLYTLYEKADENEVCLKRQRAAGWPRERRHVLLLCRLGQNRPN